MFICYELGKTEEEVRNWHLDDVYRWIAFFKLKNDGEAKALEKARAAAKRKGGK